MATVHWRDKQTGETGCTKELKAMTAQAWYDTLKDSDRHEYWIEGNDGKRLVPDIDRTIAKARRVTAEGGTL